MNPSSSTLAPALAPAERSRLVADVSRAGSVVAPYWPLTTFVAVNPLGGFTDQHFDDATAAARAWFGARTHLSLAAFRAERDRGTITDGDLDRAIVRQLGEPDALALAHRDLLPAESVELIRWDLVHGPTGAVHETSRPARFDDGTTAAALDQLLTTWCATYVDEAHVPWAMPERDRGFYRAWRAVAGGDRRLAGLVGGGASERCAALADDPAEMLALALAARGVADADRVTALRTWLLRTPGWAGFARWCDDWAPADRGGPRLRMIDLAAVRAAMDHLAPDHLDLVAGPDDAGGADLAHQDLMARRVDALLGAFVGSAPTGQQRAAVTSLLSDVGETKRAAIWLSAYEWNFRDRLLARLSPAVHDASSSQGRSSEPVDGPVDGQRGRSVAQLVFCIDVRSEGLRRQLEALGDYETFGFAGFFGVPVRWRQLGSDVAEARCPVLVSPRHEVAEAAIDDDRSYLAVCSASAGLHDAFHAAKGGIASPFALAESAGWFAGPVAAVRTLAPGRAARGAGTDARRAGRPWWRRAGAAPRTAPVVDEVAGSELRAGLSLEERTLFAEAIVTTIGMADFAPIVVLCGHGSVTSNNPHASSLDCGACGGAPGGASARIAVAILNDLEVRSALAARGIEIPGDTWFVAAEHDTTADVVTILDSDTIPAAVAPLVVDLQRDLDLAGERNAQDRADRLPGNAARVRDRGRDWAQVRPEWGLAGNGAFIIGPRSMTAGVDLRGRAFLHSYVADCDPDGVALETIMTAPLVVAQWISSQYYFSTVDPEVFGAGDKMLHNPVGGIGVVVGQTGDLAVGLPMQSVMLGEQRAHDPLRLLAVVQAPLERIDGIIVRNTTLRQLVEGEWIHVVARPTDDDAWSVRTPGGGWESWHDADESLTVLASTDLSTPLSI